MLNFSENIIKLRREKNLTQEQLADFIGVTKASVSKWETKQSLPDIMLLPALAAFFDVTVDDLLGYAPQLSKEQIQRMYHDLAEEFTKGSFEEVFEKSRKLVRKYYSCYPFLLEICRLWVNHCMLTGSPEGQINIMNKTAELCEHIINDCKDPKICSQAIMMKAGADLYCGRFNEVIDATEDMLNSSVLLNNSSSILADAYIMAGQLEKADEYIQINMYNTVLMLLAENTKYISMHLADVKICTETINRTEALIKAYDLEKLHANNCAIFRYNSAIFYCTHNMTDEALEAVKLYIGLAEEILNAEELLINGDEYFTKIEGWLEKNGIDRKAPREKKFIEESVVQSLSTPAFSVLEGIKEFEKIKERFK